MNKKVSFNYYLTNIVIPNVLFNNIDFIYEKVLPNPHNMQIFLKDMVTKANETLSENVENCAEELEFKLTLAQLSETVNAVVIEMPKAENVADNISIAITTDQNNPRYFTFEKGAPSLNPEKAGQENNFVCELVFNKDNKNFTHNNLGSLDNSRISAFAGRLVAIMNNNN